MKQPASQQSGGTKREQRIQKRKDVVAAVHSQVADDLDRCERERLQAGIGARRESEQRRAVNQPRDVFLHGYVGRQVLPLVGVNACQVREGEQENDETDGQGGQCPLRAQVRRKNRRSSKRVRGEGQEKETGMNECEYGAGDGNRQHVKRDGDR